MRIALFAPAAMLSLALAACSESKPAGQATPGAAPSAAPGAAPAAQAEAPVRKAGWWEMTSAMGPMPPQTVHTCVDAASEAKAGMVRPSTQGDGCTSTPPRRTSGGWEFAITCQSADTTMETNGKITGDLATRYRLESTSKLTPPPMPGMEEMKVVIDGRWLGACPAGRKAGDTVGPDGQVTSLAAS